MDPVLRDSGLRSPDGCRPQAAGGQGHRGTGRAGTSIAEDPDRRHDDWRHAIAMKRTDPRQPAD
jgi:hypothetical protein